jgi:hypothetical protein
MSVNAIPAQGTKVYISGTGGAAKNISAGAAGNPTILTSAAHGLSNGDVVALAAFTGTDAATLNGQTAVVTNKTTNTFAVQIDTTGKTITYSTGTATPSSWIKLGQVKTVKPSGATASKIDVTDLDSVAKEYRTGLVDNGTFSSDSFSLDSDVGQAAVLAAFNAQAANQYKVVYPSGVTPNRTFIGLVSKFPTIPDAAVDGVLTGTLELLISGAVTPS